MDINYKIEAFAIISRFKSRHDPVNSKVAFPEIGRANTMPNAELQKNIFIDELEQRVLDPFTINQGGTSLCGPAAVMFCWLSKRPDMFVKYVINMYETGEAKMGSLVVKPGADCKNNNPKKILGVDWIALAALRDSENTLLDYDDDDDQVAGITFPGTIGKWFKNIGFSVVENNTSLLFSERFKVLKEAAEYLIKGQSVCLFINSKLLNEDGINATADHWIVMTSEPIIDNKSICSISNEVGLLDKVIDFNVYTWGKNHSGSINKNRSNVQNLSDFLGCFYGFVAAEYDNYSAFACYFSASHDETAYLRI